jgi:Tfp pilus assembly protein FimV
VSEEKPSADSDLASAGASAESSDSTPETTSVPRQSPGPAVESEGAAEAVEPSGTAAPGVEPAAAVEPTTAAPAPELRAAAESPAAPETPVTSPVVAPAPPKKKRGLLTGAVFGLIVLVLVAAIGVLVYLRLYADPTKNATAGNCLADLPIVAVGEDREVTNVRVVDCGDAAATHVVEARIDNKTEAEAKSASVCEAYPSSTFIYRAVPQGGTGYVLCLRELAK